MLDIEGLKAVRKSVADEKKPFNIWNPWQCIASHAARLRGRDSPCHETMLSYGLEAREAYNLVYPGAAGLEDLPGSARIEREDAVAMLDRIIAGGTVRWTEVLGLGVA